MGYEVSNCSATTSYSGVALLDTAHTSSSAHGTARSSLMAQESHLRPPMLGSQRHMTVMGTTSCTSTACSSSLEPVSLSILPPLLSILVWPALARPTSPAVF